MTKWEYEIFRTIHPELPISPAKIEAHKETFAGWGKEGWELVSVDNGIAYFKRPIPPVYLIDVEAGTMREIYWGDNDTP